MAGSAVLASPTGGHVSIVSLSPAKEFAVELTRLRPLVETDIPALEKMLDKSDAPSAPAVGREVTDLLTEL